MGCCPRAHPGTRGTKHAVLAAVFALTLAATASARSPLVKPGSVSPLLRHVTDLGRVPATERHQVVVGLELRNRAALDSFLIDVHDPASPRYHRFLSQDEFNGLYAPTETDEQAVVSHLTANGLRVTARSYCSRYPLTARRIVACRRPRRRAWTTLARLLRRPHSPRSLRCLDAEAAGTRRHIARSLTAPRDGACRAAGGSALFLAAPGRP